MYQLRVRCSCINSHFVRLLYQFAKSGGDAHTSLTCSFDLSRHLNMNCWCCTAEVGAQSWQVVREAGIPRVPPGRHTPRSSFILNCYSQDCSCFQGVATPAQDFESRAWISGLEIPCVHRVLLAVTGKSLPAGSDDQVGSGTGT